jgi:hypothetical protein
VSWYRVDQIDEIAFDDLATWFDDIWYPNSDDLDICDDTLSWVVSINHEGDVNWIRF